MDASNASPFNGADQVTLPTLRAVGADDILPDARGLVAAVARYGYSLHHALADLIDNSVDAGASNVTVRFFRDDAAILRIVVADDGRGLDETGLRLAMQFGVQVEHGLADLGKYGLGLKSASLSQAQSVSLVTRNGAGWTGGRRWTMELIERGWICERLDAADCAELLDADWNTGSRDGPATLIVWDGLDRLRLGRAGVDVALRGFMRRLPVDLGIIFHRFLGDGRLRVRLDVEHTVTGERSAPTPVEPLDPFAHRQSGRAGYPVTFSVQVGQGPPLALRAHIWPANSKETAYRLGGGKIAERQGLYFYRNDRVIQAGGWNGWRQNDSEPHTSLARAAIDLPPELDTLFRLDVKKSRLDAPPKFITELDGARAGSTPLKDWIEAAVDTYRSAADRPSRDAPAVPGSGLPAELRRLFARRSDLGPLADRREMPLVWEDLDDDRFFEIDREGGRVILNRSLRTGVLQGARASGADAPLVKTLLFLLLRPELDHQRSSAVRRRMLDEANALLREALRLQSW